MPTFEVAKDTIVRANGKLRGAGAILTLTAEEAEPAVALGRLIPVDTPDVDTDGAGLSEALIAAVKEAGTAAGDKQPTVKAVNALLTNEKANAKQVEAAWIALTQGKPAEPSGGDALNPE
ncbi:MAG: hypothetical protein ACPGO3_00385 [Magnetospiraceae bacterium]